MPTLLSIAFNSYGPLTDESAVRMAFASVAGATTAIVSAIAAVMITVVRRRRLGPIMGSILIALIVVTYSWGTLQSAEKTLLQRLENVAEVDLLNQ